MKALWPYMQLLEKAQKLSNQKRSSLIQRKFDEEKSLMTLAPEVSRSLCVLRPVRS